MVMIVACLHFAQKLRTEEITNILNAVLVVNIHIFIYQQEPTSYSMEQSRSWEANRFADSQEIPRILWNPKFHYRIHNGPPPVPEHQQEPTNKFVKR